MDSKFAMDSSKPSSASNDALHIGGPSSSSQPLNHAGPVDLFADGAGMRLTHIDADGAVLRPLIQRINESGVDHKEILRAVMPNIVELSTHWLGSYAVEVCILKAAAAADRELLVYAFAALPDHELAELVQNEYGNYVVQKLLRSAKDDFPEQVGGLARRIEQLPKCVLEQTYAKKVVRAIGKMFARRGD